MMAEICPICGADSKKYISGSVRPSTFFTRASDYKIASGEGKEQLSVRRCRACGHGFSSLDVSADVIAAWYARASVDESFLRETTGRRKTARMVLDRIANWQRPPGKLLDVGCGPGFFLDEAQRRQWEVAGVEVAPWAVEHARRALQLPHIIQGDVGSLHEFAPGEFDVVCAFDVIEHVVSPAEFLASVRRVVRPGGLLVLTTPWFGSLTAQLMGRRWYCIFPAHIHYFTRQSLGHALAQERFEVVDVRRHTRYLGWRYVWGRFLHQWGLGPGTTNRRSEFLLPMNLGDEFELYARAA